MATGRPGGGAAAAMRQVLWTLATSNARHVCVDTTMGGASHRTGSLVLATALCSASQKLLQACWLASGARESCTPAMPGIGASNRPCCTTQALATPTARLNSQTKSITRAMNLVRLVQVVKLMSTSGSAMNARLCNEE